MSAPSFRSPWSSRPLRRRRPRTLKTLGAPSKTSSRKSSPIPEEHRAPSGEVWTLLSTLVLPEGEARAAVLRDHGNSRAGARPRPCGIAVSLRTPRHEWARAGERRDGAFLIASAIADALSPVGIRVSELRLSPARLRPLMRSAGSGGASPEKLITDRDVREGKR